MPTSSGKTRRNRDAAALLRQLIIDRLLSSPANSLTLEKASGATRGAISGQLHAMSQLDIVAFGGRGAGGMWHVTDGYRALLARREKLAAARAQMAEAATSTAGGKPGCLDADTASVPVVQLHTDPAWTLPSPAIVKRADGVIVTTQAAPAGRFAVSLTPGSGVISMDNPGLARLAHSARRGTGGGLRVGVAV